MQLIALQVSIFTKAPNPTYPDCLHMRSNEAALSKSDHEIKSQSVLSSPT